MLYHQLSPVHRFLLKIYLEECQQIYQGDMSSEIKNQRNRENATKLIAVARGGIGGSADLPREQIYQGNSWSVRNSVQLENWQT